MSFYPKDPSEFVNENPTFVTKSEVDPTVLPAGGTTNQVLSKNSNSDFDLKWADGGAGGSFSSANIARVDPNGDDDTGAVGDMTKPFLTVQAAITDLEAYSIVGNGIPVLEIGTTVSDEDVTTSLIDLIIHGNSEYEQVGPSIGSLTLTSEASGFTLVLDGIIVNNGITLNPPTGGSCEVLLKNSIVVTDIICNGDASSALSVTGLTQVEPGPGYSVGGTIDCTGGGQAVVYGPIRVFQVGNTKSCSAFLFNCQVANVSVDALTIIDARPITDFSTWEWNSLTTTDKLLNPAWMDFSTLPTSDPAIVGRAWMNSGVFSISSGPPP